jgi:HK97 family phage prohead protease
MDPISMHKTFSATAGTTEGGEPGEFTAIVSAFGNEDSQGDIVEPGAFTKTLAEWVIKGRPIPVVWSHQFDDPDAFLGEYTSAEETEAGLKLTGLLDLDHPKAARVHSLMKRGVIVEFSISGMVRDYELIEKDEDGSWWFPPMRIKDIDLWEAGPCFKGANAETELLSVKTRMPAVPTTPERIRKFMETGRAIREAMEKSAPVLVTKEGRVLAQKHVDALKDAHAKLGEIIAAAEPEPAATEPPADVPPPAKAALTPSVRALLELSQLEKENTP